MPAVAPARSPANVLPLTRRDARRESKKKKRVRRRSVAASASLAVCVCVRACACPQVIPTALWDAVDTVSRVQVCATDAVASFFFSFFFFFFFPELLIIITLRGATTFKVTQGAAERVLACTDRACECDRVCGVRRQLLLRQRPMEEIKLMNWKFVFAAESVCLTAGRSWHLYPHSGPERLTVCGVSVHEGTN